MEEKNLDSKSTKVGSKNLDEVSKEDLKLLLIQNADKLKKFKEENDYLKEVIKQRNSETFFREIDVIFNCLDRKECFSEGFITTLCDKLEKMLIQEETNGAEGKSV